MISQPSVYSPKVQLGTPKGKHLYFSKMTLSKITFFPPRKNGLVTVPPTVYTTALHNQWVKEKEFTWQSVNICRALDAEVPTQLTGSKHRASYMQEPEVHSLKSISQCPHK